MNDIVEPPSPAMQTAPKIGEPAPDFSARTTQGPLTLSALRGHWVMLFAHPADFTPVCTSEFIALSRAAEDFEKLDCALVGISVDSLPSHLAWVETIRTQFGVTVPFPIVEDPTMAIARAYGTLDAASENSATVRTVHVIDPGGVIRAMTWYPMSVGRSVAELLRLVAALQAAADGEALTPEGWMPGEPTFAPPPQTQDALARTEGAWFMQLAHPKATD
ncbi:peroxiredoxin [Brytella acorum]|uniref:Thioredoxin peroxidase n=1 Tax=Brytella acorum TaxID=2959299 RepID=A0AA35UNP4_9PROT|nr:peroxiredoxin [Brytella acorum]MDF3625257.1 peroxiredoxin [Brytella acorum]CAI9119331.1 peroxiredoxin [Brytella acorum]